MKIKIVLVQLGSPRSPEVSAVRRYLKEFLGDPRVVDLSPIAWKIILNLFVLPFRPRRSARLYRRIWNGSGFPLVELSQSFAKKLHQELAPSGIEVDLVFLLSVPRLNELWDQWEQQKRSGSSADFWLVIPLFPQYSESTTLSVLDRFFHEAKRRTLVPAFEFLPFFYHSKFFIDQSVAQIENFLETLRMQGKTIDHLVVSFHGIPKRRVMVKQDPYFQQCYETFHLLRSRILSLNSNQIHLSFQSRFGSEEWLTPYTEEMVFRLLDQGGKGIAICSPSFVTDCLETLDELGHELSRQVEEKGGSLYLIPCLNDQDSWVKGFAQFLSSWVIEGPLKRSELFYSPIIEKTTMPEVKMQSPPLSDSAKQCLKIMFLTLFLDLVGFSIIFPLFPELLKYYVEKDPQNFFLKTMLNAVVSLTGTPGNTSADHLAHIVLFGGILGAIYSFLQFLAAPFWGALSDKIGRRPVLLISLVGLASSYGLWFFSGSFTLLILARFIGGIMGGNISTATAVVADITPRESRSRGMAIIGIAFALGFIIGPAFGGILSQINLLRYFPGWEVYGVNPFSMPALIALVLSLFNFFWIYRKFNETLPPEKRGQQLSDRKANPLQLFKPFPFKGVNQTNLSNFLFITAFSGMEFTLTFLAFERLHYTSLQNGFMFIFIGFLIAIVQGGIVRRKAAQVGERKMALMGLITLVPGLILIALTRNNWILYSGLFFLAVGSSLTIPCLTSLVSIYTPAEHQGKTIGIFRSLGALGRVLGPILASVIFWRFGSQWPYFIGSAFLLIPILMVSRLPKPLPDELLHNEANR
ncbi:MAG: ferrochelatase [Planctomycetota bacterium]